MSFHNQKKNERNLLFVLAGFILIGFLVVNSLEIVDGQNVPEGYEKVPEEFYDTGADTYYYNPDNPSAVWYRESGMRATSPFASGSPLSSVQSQSTAQQPPITNSPASGGSAPGFNPSGGDQGFVSNDPAGGDFAETPTGSQYDQPVNPEDIASGTTGDEVQNIDGVWAGMGKGFLGNIAEGALWAAGAYGAVQLFGPILGLDQSQTDALSESAAVGILGGKAILGGVQQWGNPAYASSAGIYGGVAIGVLYYVENYEDTSQEKVQFTCLPWQPPRGGENCETCNNEGFPCSEYQCRSLGQSCELVNKGTNEERCVYVNRNDVNPPIIQPNRDVLDEGYIYSPDDSISPPDRGVEIINDKSSDGCIPPFTPLSFGVALDEPATCKVDDERKENYEDMQLFASDGLSRYNHTFSLSLPGPSSSENITVENDGQFSAYIRCKDANDNTNVGNFVFNYCVQEGPDTTPPQIIATSINSGLPIAYNQSSVEGFQLYLNEPAECRWSHNDRDYDLMENEMSCSTSVTEFNAQSLYTCTDTLSGLRDRTENNFYFRCRDQPNAPDNERNTNAESRKLSLIGTQPLILDSVSPNETTVSDATDSVRVTLEATTSAGYREGEATCSFSETGNEGSYIEFANTARTHEHSQDLFLPEGEYVYFIRCTDLGGNTDEERIEFSVDSDNEAPRVVRAYKEENFLKLITNENGQCVYDTTNCNYLFEDGTSMNTQNDVNHFTEWDKESNLYVKCKDDFGNQPNPDQCSIIVRTTKF